MEEKEDNEISLFDLFAVLWHRKKMIITITALAAIGVVVFSLISIVLPPEKSFFPNQYTASALMLIENRSSVSGLSSLLSDSSLGGLVSLAGINIPVSTSFSGLAVYLVRTNSFLDAVTDEFNLITRYKIKQYPRAASRKALKKILLAAFDDKSGILSISFTDTDPVFASDVVNFCVTYLEKRFDELGLDKNKIEKENLEQNIANTIEEIEQHEDEIRNLEQAVVSSFGGLPVISRDISRITMEMTAKRQVYTQLKIQYELLKISMVSETPVFQVLELAEVPDMKSKPGRGMICIIVTMAAVMFSVFLAFFLNAVSNIKNDPEFMAKLRKTQ
jgi:uncharacterized protein involved in exopolysaccharide biosynthesis